MQPPQSQLTAKAHQWNVDVHKTWETSSSLIAFGQRQDSRVVLKIAKQAGDESHSGAVLKAFGGSAVEVLESETGAVLLERLYPGDPLVDVSLNGDDDKATVILARVVEALAHHAAPDVCPTVADWGRGFDRYLHSGDKQLNADLILQARDCYIGLVNS